MRKVMSSVFFCFNILMFHLKIITIYYSANMLKNYCIDEKSNVVCFSFNIFLFHLKIITA